MIHHFNSLDSTNAYALAHAGELAHGDLVVAATQTAGRGRRERTWFSPDSANFYGTFVVKPQSPLLEPTVLVQLAAVAIADALPDFHLPDAWIKWPNDVCVDDRKLAGVLIESAAVDGKEVFAVGIGVNLNMPPNELSQIDQPATSVAVETGKTVDPVRFAEAMHRILRGLWDLVANGRAKEIHKRWAADNPLIGKTVEITGDSKPVKGTVLELRKDGALVLQTNHGKQQFLAGNVSLEL